MDVLAKKLNIDQKALTKGSMPRSDDVDEIGAVDERVYVGIIDLLAVF